MTTTLYLDGTKAYIRHYGIASHKVNKGDFESLINDNDNVIDVIVNRDTAEKYARRMNRLGYFLTAKTEYGMFTYKLTYQAVD